jgi:ATP-binding cassette subfamily B protein
VSFSYDEKNMVIENANLSFEPGKTYALVGPTGGGKSTLASIMAHLYDPTTGYVYLNGKDITMYSQEETAKEISVILQDPILFTGTVAENILYANSDFKNISIEDLNRILEHKGFKEVIQRFEQGLATVIKQNGAGLSIGQRQLVSFMRAILREPKLLILDEATANIDTVTEAILTKTLAALPPETTKIIIAHRLNTIKDADEIMFVNGHHVTPAGSYDHAISLITEAKRSS